MRHRETARTAASTLALEIFLTHLPWRVANSSREAPQNAHSLVADTQNSGYFHDAMAKSSGDTYTFGNA